MQIDQARFTGIVTTATAATGAILQGVTAARPVAQAAAPIGVFADEAALNAAVAVATAEGNIGRDGAFFAGERARLQAANQPQQRERGTGANIGAAFADNLDVLASGVTDIVMSGILDATGHKVFGRCELPDGTRVNEVDGGTPIPLNW